MLLIDRDDNLQGSSHLEIAQFKFVMEVIMVFELF